MDLDSGRLVAANVLVADAAHLAEPSYVEEFLRVLTARIHMKPLTAPMSVTVQPDPANVGDPHADDGGMTTQVIISTSHIAYHSWPLQKRFRIVVDSCKDYNVATFQRSLHEWFPVNGISIQNLCYQAPELLYAETQEPEAQVHADEEAGADSAT